MAILSVAAAAHDGDEPSDREGTRRAEGDFSGPAGGDDMDVGWPEGPRGVNPRWVCIASALQPVCTDFFFRILSPGSTFLPITRSGARIMKQMGQPCLIVKLFVR